MKINKTQSYKVDTEFKLKRNWCKLILLHKFCFYIFIFQQYESGENIYVLNFTAVQHLSHCLHFLIATRCSIHAINMNGTSCFLGELETFPRTFFFVMYVI